MTLLEKILEDNEAAHKGSDYGEQEEFWSDWSDSEMDGYEVVESEIYDQRRWVTVHRDVVKHEDFPDEYVAIFYERGSTEMQESDRDNTRFEKVVPVEVTIRKFVKAKDDE